jgi:uncharacterized protein (DUF1330 family)
MSSFELEALRASDDDGPVTMLNLVKYRERAADGDGTGRDAYQRYASRASGYVERVGGKALWAGILAEAALDEGDNDTDWDWGLLVWYPSRRAFLDMVTSDDYLAANEHRLAGCAKHWIQAAKTLLWEPPPES